MLSRWFGRGRQGRAERVSSATAAVHQAAASDNIQALMRHILFEELLSPQSAGAITPLGRTPLHTASAVGAARAVRILVQTMDATTVGLADLEDGVTALHLAASPTVSSHGRQYCMSGQAVPHPEVIHLLAFECSHAIDVCARDVRGRTALHLAAAAEPAEAALEACRTLIVAVLHSDEIIAAGDPRAVGRLGRLIRIADVHGHTAEDCAPRATHSRVRTYLRATMASTPSVGVEEEASAELEGLSEPLVRRTRTEPPLASAKLLALERQHSMDDTVVGSVVRRRRAEAEVQAQMRLELQAGTIHGVPPAGRCFVCELSGEPSAIMERHALRWPCGHVNLCVLCFLEWLKSQVDSMPWPELVNGRTLRCNDCSQPIEADGISGLLTAAQALVPAGTLVGAAPNTMTPAELLGRWTHLLAEVRTDEAAAQLTSAIRTDPSVRFCTDPNCACTTCSPPDLSNLPAAYQGPRPPPPAVLAKLGSHSRGFVLDPPPPHWLWRYVRRQLTFSALLVAGLVVLYLQTTFWSDPSVRQHVPLALDDP